MNDPVTRLNAALEGRYRVERELGEGGMATVYLADDLRHERKVALKVLKTELAAVVGAERFLAEIKTTANLQHPHILPLFDSGEAGGYLFYVMPYVDGESLRERLDREHQLPVDEAVQIARNVAEALDYAHSQGVIHRDIKPANILLQAGKPVVADFGIALAISAGGGDRITETGLSLGTPNYMSPEQATGDLKVGATTDIHALGCVLYEALVGNPPFQGSTPQAVLGKIVTGEAPSASQERKSVPLNVDAAIRKSLEKLPADRFGTAGEMAKVLGEPGFRWGGGASTAMLAAKQTPPARVAAISLAVLAAAVVGWSVGRAGYSPADAGVRYASILLEDGQEIARGATQQLAVTADGSTIVYVSAAIGSNTTQLWVRSRAEPVSVPIPGTEGAGSFFLSPDGASLAFSHTADGEIKSVPIRGGPPTTLAETSLVAGSFYGGAWGTDGRILFATASGIWTVPENGGTPEAIVETDPGLVRPRQPRFLPDGRGIIFSRQAWQFPYSSEIVVRHWDGEEAVLVEGHSPWITSAGHLLFARGGDGEGEVWAAQLGADGLELSPPVRVLTGVLEVVAPRTPQILFALSTAGHLVYAPSVRGSASWQLLRVSREDGEIEVLLDAVSPQFAERPVWLDRTRVSPDGLQIAFTGYYDTDPNYRLFVYDLARRRLDPINLAANGDYPIFRADGGGLLFNRFKEGEGAEMYSVTFSGGANPTPLIAPNPEVQHPQAISPDGRYIVFQQRESENSTDSDILYLDGNSETHPLLTSPFQEIHPALSPDARYLAFASDQSGQQSVFVTEFPEALELYRVSTEVASAPVWSPAGNELFYVRADGTLMVVQVDTEGVFEYGTPEPVFEEIRFPEGGLYGRRYDVSSDASHFYLHSRQSRGPITRVEWVGGWLGDVSPRLQQR